MCTDRHSFPVCYELGYNKEVFGTGTKSLCVHRSNQSSRWTVAYSSLYHSRPTDSKKVSKVKNTRHISIVRRTDTMMRISEMAHRWRSCGATQTCRHHVHDVPVTFLLHVFAWQYNYCVVGYSLYIILLLTKCTFARVIQLTLEVSILFT